MHQVFFMLQFPLPGSSCTLVVALADITSYKVDAIINAANDKMEHGAGVAAAIVKKGIL